MGKKILVTDDEPNIVKVVAARLKTYQYEVISAYDGEEALAKVESEKPDIILLDLQMPKMTGAEVCQKLKADERFKHIPVVLFTAKTQDSADPGAVDYGADAYVLKPFQPQQLLDTIKSLLGDPS